MKRHFNFILCMLAAILMGTSCVYRIGNENGHHGSGHTRYPNEFYLSESSAQCWGYYYNEKTLNYTLKLSSGRYSANGDFVGEGVELSLDLLAKPSENMFITAGTYTISHDNFVPMVFLDGYEEDGQVYPSYFYVKYRNGNYLLETIQNGTVTIDYRGNEMIVDARVYTRDRKLYKFTYQGVVRVENHAGEVNPGTGGGSGSGSGSGTGNVKADYKMDFVAGASYKGTEFSKDTDNYSLTLASGQYADNGDFVDKGVELAIDFLCKTSSTIALQTGTYTCTFNEYKPLRFLEGFYSEDDECTYPTYVYIQYDNKGNYDLLNVIDGTIKVSQSNGDYTIAADLVVDDGKKSRYTFDYKGRINFSNDAARANTKSGTVRREDIQKGRKGAIRTKSSSVLETDAKKAYICREIL